MPICIECRYPISQLYHVLQSRNKHSAAPTPSNPSHRSSASSLVAQASPQRAKSPKPRDTPSAAEATKSSNASTDVRLTQCPNCKRFADKYVEHDNVVIFIDLVLVKPQVYRHVLFNSFQHDQEDLDPSIRRLSSLLVLFDVYLTMIRIENLTERSPPPLISTYNVIFQWFFYLLVCSLAMLAQHISIRWIAQYMGFCGLKSDSKTRRSPIPTPNGTTTPGNPGGAEPPKPPTPNAISTALTVSSCMNLFPVLMIVWGAHESNPASEPAAPSSSLGIAYLPHLLFDPARSVGWVNTGVMWAVALQNLEALTTLLGCDYAVGVGLVLVGGVLKWVVKEVMMSGIGIS